MGATVIFKKDSGTITTYKSTTKIMLVLGSTTAFINGSRSRMLFAPFEKNGRTYVPLRFISEALGCRVSWHPPTATVAISTDPEKDPFDDLKPERSKDNGDKEDFIEDIDTKFDDIDDIKNIDSKDRKKDN